jgi:alpha-glucosidase (family GH31 glycosyl hydrolase)
MPMLRLPTFSCALIAAALCACSSKDTHEPAQDAGQGPPVDAAEGALDATPGHDASGDGDAALSEDAGHDAGGPGPFNDGQWVKGHARFTAITPTLLRVEYDPQGQFVDSPSYFAREREARFHHAAYQETGSGATLDTGAFKLVYTDDGQPFSTTNLTLQLSKSGLAFSPAADNPENLGGTTRTLDRWDGPGKLDDGILTRAGWYKLDDSHGHLLDQDWVHERDSQEQDWYVFAYGADYKAALRSLTAIGGKVPMPRRHVLGAWYSRYYSYTSAEFEAIADEYDAHDFPLDMMVLDMGWHLDGWTGWTWNNDLIPDPPALLSNLHDRGLQVTLNVHPSDGVAPYERAYGDFMHALGKDPASQETVPFDTADKPYMDALFTQVHAPLTHDGADFFWLDWQQAEFTRSIPTLTNLRWLNELYYRYEQRDGLRGLSFSRWGDMGDHRHPIHFSGDASTTFQMLAFEVPFTATSSNSGLFFWSHDIGGHVGARNEESYTRWCQFGAFSAALRSHSFTAEELDRRPWKYPDWAEASMRTSFHLRSQFFPYLYSSVFAAHDASLPLVRSLYIEYPDVADAYKQPQQYLFGDALLVAPVAEAGAGARRLGRQVVWFPEGTFHNYFTGERFVGPSEQLVAATIDELPLFVRAGVPVVMQPYQKRMASTPISELHVRCYPGEDGKTGRFVLHEDDGETDGYLKSEYASTKLSCSRKGDTLLVHVAATEGKYPGQLSERAYVIEVPATERASVIQIDGKNASVDYDAGTLTNRVRVASRGVDQALDVSLQVKSVSDDTLRTRAFAQRTGVATNLTLANMVSAAWSNAGSEAEKLAVLAAAGSGAFAKNENLYGYPLAPHFIAYKQPWAAADIKITAGWRGGVQQVQTASVTFAGQQIDSTVLSGDVDFAHRGVDLAQTATATFSSQETNDSTGIADGKVGGYPEDRAQEWSTAGEKTGASVTLTWSSAQQLAHVILFDRINANDQITSGTLSFSDGSTVHVGSIPNTPQAGPLLVDFAARSVTSVKFTVDSVSASTENVGLAELAVYGP